VDEPNEQRPENRSLIREPRTAISVSLQLYERALSLIPGGAQLISRRPTRFAFGVSPIFAAEASGARLRDVDGNEYLDWLSAVGPVILGYRDPAVDAAVKAAGDGGAVFSLNHPLEVELAEELARSIPCAEMVRYVKGGGEGCAVAVRIARGVTGRDKVLCCGYHGWHDWYLAANLDDETRLDEHLFSGIEPIGVPQALAGTAMPFRYGHLPMLRELLDRHAGEVACVIMEPMRSEMPLPGYLEGVRDAAARAGAVLIFDEVSTGYRPALGGAQEYLGVTPDMAVFAKSISNGYAMGAVVGRREVMEPASRMFISSTYWSDTLGIAAALATLRELRRADGVARIHATGRLLRDRLNAAIRRSGLEAACEGPDWHPALRFRSVPAEQTRLAATLFIQEMAKAGIIALPSFYINCAHTEADIDETAAAAERAFALIRRGVEKGCWDRLLEAEVQEDSFRRLVR
jgi:glutamate-1-semialdehyde 2,1-aminomutase